MTIHRLCTRLQRLEQRAHVQEEGILHLWKLQDESTEEAFARREVDPDNYPQVRVHVWIGGRIAARLARPPAPLWVSQAPPALADLEHRLQETLTQWRPPCSGTRTKTTRE